MSRAGVDVQSKRAGKAECARLLCLLTKAVVVAGLVAAVFGPPFAYVALRIVFSTRWSETDAPFVLGCYCLYVPLLAMNGTRLS